VTDEGSEVLVIMVSSIGLGEIPTCYLKLIRKEWGGRMGWRGGRDELTTWIHLHLRDVLPRHQN